MSPDAAADEAEELLARRVPKREAASRASHARGGPRGHPRGPKPAAGRIELPVDYNQALTVAEAIRRGRALEPEGIAWLEEPIRHDDYAGNAAIARALIVPVQIGENFNGPEAMVEALRAGACDYVMPDVARIGGVTGSLQAAASQQPTASTCRRICFRRLAPIFSPRRRRVTTWKTLTWADAN